MSEDGQSSVGQLLRAAREAKGIAIEDAAVRLRLMHRQIEAMEADDFESLGQPVFARGFVRNYARLLGLTPETLLDRMEGAPSEPAQVTHPEPPAPKSWLASPWLILLLIAVLVLVATPVALYLWLNSEVDEAPRRMAPAVEMAPAPVSPPEEPVPAAVPPAVEPVVEPAATVPEAAPADAGAPAAPPAMGVLRMEFGDEAWVEIKDATGSMVHRQLNAPGSSTEVRGQPPFSVVIGNASKVRMTYNGRPIDLKPFIDVTVARFTLEE